MPFTINDSAPNIPGVNYSGNWTLIYFYPKDFTSGCTTEACTFRDNFSQLKNKVEIIGISADTEESHAKFAAKYNLPFRLIADPDKQIIKDFGADGLIFPKRTSFLINPSGKIVKIYSPVKPATHAHEVLADLEAFSA